MFKKVISMLIIGVSAFLVGILLTSMFYEVTSPAGSDEYSFYDSDNEYDYAEEIKKEEQFLKDNPKDSAAKLKLADLYYEDGRYEGALKVYLEFLEIEPGNMDVFRAVADCYLNLRELQEAKQMLLFLYEEDELNWLDEMNIVWLDLLDDHYEKALAQVEELHAKAESAYYKANYKGLAVVIEEYIEQRDKGKVDAEKHILDYVSEEVLQGVFVEKMNERGAQ